MVDYANFDRTADYSAEIAPKLAKLSRQDPDTLAQLERYTESLTYGPDRRARNKLIRLGILEIDGSLRPEMCRSVCKVLNEQKIVPLKKRNVFPH